MIQDYEPRGLWLRYLLRQHQALSFLLPQRLHDGPSNPGNGFFKVTCYSNGTLDETHCGPVGFPPGAENFSFSARTDSSIAIQSVIALGENGQPYLSYGSGDSTDIGSTRSVYIRNNGGDLVNIGGANIYQQSGSPQTVTFNVYSDFVTTNLISTTSQEIPSGVETTVDIPPTQFAEVVISFPADIYWGANAFQLTSVNPPATYSFCQEGYSEDAYISGTFTGSDLNSDGQITNEELTDFTASFSGNSLVGPLSFTFENLGGFVYDNDGGPLGDGTTGGTEGIGLFGTGDSYYFAGPGPADLCGIGVDCAEVSDGSGTDTSQQLIPINGGACPSAIVAPATPVPAFPLGAIWILGGLAGLLGMRRLLKNAQSNPQHP